MKDFVLDIRELLSKPQGAVDFQMKGMVEFPEECPLEGDILLTGRCQGIGDRLMLVSGELSYTASGFCARCLVPTVKRVTAEFSERFSRAPDDDEEIFRYAGDSLDLSEAIRQTALLEYPEKLLCKEDCRGICPICGQVLNERDCGCATKGSDLEED